MFLIHSVEPDGARILTSDHIEELDDCPPRLVILGAGVVGCEYATIFARLRRTEVHLLDRAARILPFEDEDVSASVDASLRELGVVIHQGARLASVSRREDGVDCHLENGTIIAGSHLLLSVGRAAAVDDLGLELAGVERTETGAIRVAGTTSTAAHIHAAGDTTADVALANVAEVEARHAVEEMFGLVKRSFRLHAFCTNGEARNFQRLAKEVDVVFGVADDLLPQSSDLLGQ